MNIGIFLFNQFEVLDFAGPLEVFSLAAKGGKKAFNVFTIGEMDRTLSAQNSLVVKPNYTIHNHPPLDVLIIPGGYGAEHIELKNATLLKWVIEQSKKVKYLVSICTGVFILAEAGILNHKKATTHWLDYNRLAQQYPLIHVVREVPFVDEGSILTSGGIATGIDLAFYLLVKTLGFEAAEIVAKHMVYEVDLMAYQRIQNPA